MNFEWFNWKVNWKEQKSLVTNIVFRGEFIGHLNEE